MKNLALRTYLLYLTFLIFGSTFSQGVYFGEYVDTNVLENQSSLHISGLNEYYISYVQHPDKLCIKRKIGADWVTLNNSSKIIDLNVKQQLLIGDNNSDSLYLIYIDNVLPDQRLCVKLYNGLWHPTAEFILPDIGVVGNFIATIDTIAHNLYILLDQQGGNYYFLKYEMQTNVINSVAIPPLDYSYDYLRSDLIFNPSDSLIYFSTDSPTGTTIFCYDGNIWNTLIENCVEFVPAISYSRLRLINNTNDMYIYYLAINNFGSLYFGIKRIDLQTLNTDIILPEIYSECLASKSTHFGINPINNTPYYCQKILPFYHLNFILDGINYSAFSPIVEDNLNNLSHDTNGFLYYTTIYQNGSANYLGVKTFGEEVLGESKNYSTSIKLEVYPNPSNGNFQIIVPDNYKSESTELEIYELSGKTIRRESITLSQNSISVHGLLPGSYIIRIILADRQYFEKVIIQ